jgi:hypothetical protein
MGSDCTSSALENRFRRIKQDGKRINDAISTGVDPLSLGIGSGEGTNSGSLYNHFPYYTAVHNVLLTHIWLYWLAAK